MTRAASAAPRKDEATGTWWFIVDTGTGPEGQRLQARRKGFRTRREAQEALDKLRRSVTTQTFVAPAKQTLAEYLDSWTAGLPTRLRPSTVDGYKRTLLYVPPGLGARRLDRVTAADLDGLYADLLASGLRQREGGLSARTVRYLHTILHKALADAVDRDLLVRNVAEKAKPPRAKDTKPPEQQWWTPEQLRQFLDLTAHEPLGPVFRLASMTGMRRGEVCGLRWSDVDLDKARLEVRQQLLVVRSPGAPDGGLQFSERTKTDHGRRRIDLDPGTVAVLRTQKRRQAEHRLALGAGWRNEHDLVFTEPDGRPLDPESVAKVFARRVERSGLPRLRFHDLRHSHTAHLIAAGTVPILAISKRLGHASTSFTMDRYGHLFEDAGSEAAAAVSAMVDGA
ncbi:MAG: tyrosine-type recombinase/integrase [Acidimicrobiales bacterium]|jgi:integrase